MKLKLVYITLILLFTANGLNAQSPSHFRPVIVSAQDSGPASRLSLDPVTPLGARIENNQLFVQMQYGGGCQKHEFHLFTLPALFQPESGVLPVFIAHESNGDRCKAMLVKEIAFPLTDFRALAASNGRMGEFEIRLHAPMDSVPLKQRIMVQ